MAKDDETQALPISVGVAMFLGGATLMASTPIFWPGLALGAAGGLVALVGPALERRRKRAKLQPPEPVVSIPPTETDPVITALPASSEHAAESLHSPSPRLRGRPEPTRADSKPMGRDPEPKIEIEEYDSQRGRVYMLAFQNTIAPRKVSAHVTLRGDCYRLVPGLPARRYYLPWDGYNTAEQRLDRWQTHPLLVALRTVEDVRDALKLWVVAQPGTGAILLDTDLDLLSEDHLQLEVQFIGKGRLILGPIVRRYTIGWDGLKVEA